MTDAEIGIIVAGLFILLAIIFYFIPTMIVVNRKCKNGFAIVFLNIFLGWTLLVWLVCFVWACVSEPNRRNAVITPVESIRLQHSPECVNAKGSGQGKLKKIPWISLIINLILGSLLILYLVHPSIVLKHRYQAIELFNKISHRSSK